MKKVIKKIQCLVIVIIVTTTLIFFSCESFAMSKAEKIQTQMNPFKPKIPVKIVERVEPSNQAGQIQRNSPARGGRVVNPSNPSGGSPLPQRVEPVQPKEPTVIPLPELILNGHVWNSDRPQAIIDGEIKEIGDSVSFLKVTDIQKEGIQLKAPDGRTMLLTPGGNP